MRLTLTYDDVQLVPKYSEISSRSKIKLYTKLTKRYSLLIPYVASPMDTVCESNMAIKMLKLGGVGCIHRFLSVDQQCEEVRKVKRFAELEDWFTLNKDFNPIIKEIPIMAAVGVMQSDILRAQSLVSAGVNVILIDVAHGHHINVKNMITELKSILPEYVDIIAGNISTKESAEDLCEWGADGIRVGVGSGSLCTTRIQTGHGVPSITTISDCVLGSKVPVMADGGIRTSGDIAKALSLGADTVMLGSILAGTQETPGSVIEKGNHLYKKYRGSASSETKSANGQEVRNIEGESTIIPFKGGVKYVIKRLNDGVSSALSYSGVDTIEKFQEESVMVQITTAGGIEASPHLLK